MLGSTSADSMPEGDVAGRLSSGPTFSASLPEPPFQHLTIRCKSSVEEYFHFLLGFLFPLCLHLETFGTGPRPRMLVRSCGPFDRVLRELPVPEFIVCPKEVHAAAGASIIGQPFVEHIELTGFDLAKHPRTYDDDAVRRAARFVEHLLAPAIADEAAGLASQGPIRVLAIERGAPDPFYLSAASEISISGASKRRIANYAGLAETLAKRIPGFKTLTLEQVSLARQIALFRTADVVVAQHGAALANLAWMRPGTHAIEIVARGKRLGVFRELATDFSGLAKVFGVRHQFALQTGDFGRVLVGDVVRRVERAIALPDAPPLRPPVAFGAAVTLLGIVRRPNLVHRGARLLRKFGATPRPLPPA